MLLSIEVTCKNKPEAIKIAKALLKKKLVACVNIWPVDSLYWWQGKIATAKEVMLSCKSTSKHSTKIKQTITKLHSYEVPVIIIKKVEVNSSAECWANTVTQNN